MIVSLLIYLHEMCVQLQIYYFVLQNFKDGKEKNYG